MGIKGYHCIVGLTVALFLWGTALVQAQQPPDPDYCLNNYCGIGDGDCDPGQCDEGTCVNDVGARHGLPAHYDVCEAGGPDPDYCVGRTCGAGEGDCDPGQCAAGLTCVNDVGARYGLPAHYDVCEAAGPTCPQTHAFDGRWDFRLTTQGTCRNRPPATFWIDITRSELVHVGETSTASFVVLENGHIEGQITDRTGPHILALSGLLAGRTGEGVWFNFETCVGTWTARKR